MELLFSLHQCTPPVLMPLQTQWQARSVESHDCVPRYYELYQCWIAFQVHIIMPAIFKFESIIQLVESMSVARVVFAALVHLVVFRTGWKVHQHIFILNQFRLFCEHPSSGSLSEKTLEVHRNQTLGEATERAYKVQCRLCVSVSLPSLWFHVVCNRPGFISEIYLHV